LTSLGQKKEEDAPLPWHAQSFAAADATHRTPELPAAPARPHEFAEEDSHPFWSAKHATMLAASCRKLAPTAFMEGSVGQ